MSEESDAVKFLHQGSPSLTSRSCGPKGMEVDCKKDTGICTCTSDLCNNAQSFKPATGVILAVMGTMITRLLL